MRGIRLSEKEIEAIRETVKKIFGEGAEVWLFGSRVNPNLKGGDIDLLVTVPKGKKSVERKLSFLVKLKERIGEQKIDLILRELGESDFIVEEAKKTGVKH